jgi:hypothetical protein
MRPGRFRTAQPTHARVAQLALSLCSTDVLGPRGQPLLFSHPLAS